MNLQRILRLTSTGVIAMALSVSAWSQTPTTTPLPKGISDGEMEQWLAHPLDLTNPSTLRGIPTPPPGSNLRTAAEWEEIEVLTITWEGFPCILKQITAASVEECRVVIFSENVSQTTSYLTGNSCGGPVAMDSVEVVDAASNSIWIRDYGANTVYTEYNDGRCSWIGCTTGPARRRRHSRCLVRAHGHPLAQHHPSPQRFDEHWRQLDV